MIPSCSLNLLMDLVCICTRRTVEHVSCGGTLWCQCCEVPRALRRNPRRHLPRVRQLQWLRWLRVWPEHLEHLDHWQVHPLHRAHQHLHPKLSHVPSQCVQASASAENLKRNGRMKNLTNKKGKKTGEDKYTIDQDSISQPSCAGRATSWCSSSFSSTSWQLDDSPGAKGTTQDAGHKGGQRGQDSERRCWALEILPDVHKFSRIFVNTENLWTMELASIPRWKGQGWRVSGPGCWSGELFILHFLRVVRERRRSLASSACCVCTLDSCTFAGVLASQMWMYFRIELCLHEESECCSCGEEGGWGGWFGGFWTVLTLHARFLWKAPPASKPKPWNVPTGSGFSKFLRFQRLRIDVYYVT